MPFFIIFGMGQRKGHRIYFRDGFLMCRLTEEGKGYEGGECSERIAEVTSHGGQTKE